MGCFKRTWQQVFKEKKLKYLAPFWAILRNVTSYTKTDVANFLANFPKERATFLFHHLVSLDSLGMMSSY